jgi:prepilin-type N-terminal cleavage/methylation domain-containing protein
MARLRSQIGYSLIELVLVLVILGILAGLGMQSLTASHRTRRIEETRQELERLAFAIAGNPELVSSTSRIDFGYVGDVGSLPPDLEALALNPGYATWNGPYVGDPFTGGGTDSEYRYDAWGVAYNYSGGVTINSVGGPTVITRRVAGSAAELLQNRVAVVVVDLDWTPPGATFADSTLLLLTYPDGGGGIRTDQKYGSDDGYVEFDLIPVGSHLLQLVYLPTNDTLQSRVVVHPGATAYTELQMPEDLWGGS